MFYLMNGDRFLSEAGAKKWLAHEGTTGPVRSLVCSQMLRARNDVERWDMELYETWESIALVRGSRYVQLAEAVYGERCPRVLWQHRVDFGVVDAQGRRVGMTGYIEYRDGRLECRVQPERGGDKFGAMREPFNELLLGAAQDELRSRIGKARYRAVKRFEKAPA